MKMSDQCHFSTKNHKLGIWKSIEFFFWLIKLDYHYLSKGSAHPKHKRHPWNNYNQKQLDYEPSDCALY